MTLFQSISEVAHPLLPPLSLLCLRLFNLRLDDLSLPTQAFDFVLEAFPPGHSGGGSGDGGGGGGGGVDGTPGGGGVGSPVGVAEGRARSHHVHWQARVGRPEAAGYRPSAVDVTTSQSLSS